MKFGKFSNPVICGKTPKNVQPRAARMAVGERVMKCAVVDETAARGVY
jgi:hypothetical protein